MPPAFVDDNGMPQSTSQHLRRTSGEYAGSEYDGGGCQNGDCATGDCYGGNCATGDCYGGDCTGGDCYGSNCYSGGCGGGDCNCGACYNADCCGGECYEVCPPCGGYNQPKVAVWAEWLWLQATDSDIAHAQQQNGIGGAGTVPFGDIGTVEMDYESGARFGAAIGCSDCARVVFSWTNFETDATASLGSPDIAGGGGAVGSLVHHPGAAITASVGPVDAFNEIEVQLADVMFHRICRSSHNYYIGFLAGAQYGHLEQRFSQTGVFSGGQGGTIDTATEIKFDGGGLKAGFDGESVIGGGISAYGRLTGAAMSGRFKSRYGMLNSTTDIALAGANWSDDRIVPNLEYELGLAWTSCRGCLRLSTGYMFSHWMNVVTTPEFIDAVQANNYVDVGDTLSFDGVVTRAELRW